MLKQETRPAQVDRLEEQLARVILGKPNVLDNMLVALFSGSHILMEDVPGVGKTTLAKALSRSISGEFSRIQFTPDLLPADVLGSSIYNPKDGSFRFKKGPILANILLADEINRASPRTQSSLLEAMSERQASIEGETRPLPSPFLVIATQNPIEFHGTYPLPEAQLDRFGMKVGLGYPPKEQEVEMLYSQFHHHPLEDVEPVLDARDVVAVQETVFATRLDRKIGQYLVELAEATRQHPSLKIGCSPRGTLALFRAGTKQRVGGTVKYIAPEQARGHTTDARTDIYSLGATLYELITGTAPFTTGNIVKHHLETPAPPITPKHSAVPPALDELVLKCLAKDPDERFATARGMIAFVRSENLLELCAEPSRVSSTLGFSGSSSMSRKHPPPTPIPNRPESARLRLDVHRFSHLC